MTCRTRLISTASIFGLITSPALAQNQGSPIDGREQDSIAAAEREPAFDAASGDIIVTARRRSESLYEVPIAITALSSETIQQQQITSEIDLQRAVPGLTIRQGGSANQYNFALRGQSIDTYSGSPPAVLSYINEVQIVQQSASAFYDLAGIQVLKGPQGTLFGRNSTGGAVLFQTASPSDDFGGYLIGRYGNYRSKYLEGAINVPLGERADLRVAGAYTGGGAYVENILTNRRLGKKDIKSVRGTLLLKPIDNLTNSTVVQHTSEGGNNAPNVIYTAYPCGGPPVNGYTLVTTTTCTYNPANPAFNAYIAAYPRLAPFAGGLEALAQMQRRWGPWKVAIDANLSHRAKSTFGINTTTFELSPVLTLKNIVGYNKSRASDGLDYDGSPYPIVTTGGVLSADGTMIIDNGKNLDTATEQFSNEFQIQGKAFDNRLVYVLGAYWLDQTYDVTSNILAFGGIGPGANLTYQAEQKNSSRALFAQGTYKVTDPLSLTAGFRYTWDTLSQTTGEDSVYFPFFGRARERMKAHKPSWTVSLDYQLTPSTLVYITQRGSWRAGGYNFSVAPVPTTAVDGGNVFVSETTKDIEIGLKYNGNELGLPASFTIAAYNQWIDDVQRGGFAPPLGLLTTSVPKGEVTGVEAALSITPADWLTIGGAAAYTNARYTEAEVVLFTNLIRYGPFADTPKFTGSVFFDATYELPGEAGRLVLHGDGFGQTKFAFSNVADTISPGSSLKGYVLINGRLSWNNVMGSKVSAAFYVRNLLDEVYYTGGTSGEGLGHNQALGGQPRMFGGELRIDF